MEDTLHFNQIRSTEMMGFFEKNQLVRYDALGGVSAVFYMQKDHQISNVNIKQAKSLTAVIENANAKKMLYIEEIKSDAYPLHQIEMDKQRLKGFEWRPDERPVSRYDITDMSMPESSRDEFDSRNRPKYVETDRYYDNYMRNIFRKLRDEDLRKVVAEKGYYPQDMPIARYPLGFIQGVLIGAFDQVAEAIESDPGYLPF